MILTWRLNRVLFYCTWRYISNTAGRNCAWGDCWFSCLEICPGWVHRWWLWTLLLAQFSRFKSHQILSGQTFIRNCCINGQRLYRRFWLWFWCFLRCSRLCCVKQWRFHVFFLLVQLLVFLSSIELIVVPDVIYKDWAVFLQSELELAQQGQNLRLVHLPVSHFLDCCV